MNATTLSLPAIRFAAIPAPTARIAVALPAERARSVSPRVAAQVFTLEPLVVPPADALDAGRACSAHPAHDTLARYAAPPAPALFHVC